MILLSPKTRGTNNLSPLPRLPINYNNYNIRISIAKRKQRFSGFLICFYDGSKEV